MKRAMILGFSVAFGASAWAQSPVSVYPGTTVRTRPTGDATPATRLAPAESLSPASAVYATMPVTRTPATLVAAQPSVAPARFDALQPLGGLLSMPLPTSPTVSAGVCASGACGTTCPPACGTPLFPTTARDGVGNPRPCFDRVLNWPAPKVEKKEAPNSKEWFYGDADPADAEATPNGRFWLEHVVPHNKPSE